MVASVVVCMVNGVSMVDQRWSMVEANGIWYLQWWFVW